MRFSSSFVWISYPETDGILMPGVNVQLNFLSSFCNLELTHIASYKLPRQEIVCNVKHAACCFLFSSTLKQVGADLMDFVPAHLFLALEFALARRIDLSEMRRMLSGSPPGGETPIKAPGSPSMSLVFLHFHVIRLFYLRVCVPLFLDFFLHRYTC